MIRIVLALFVFAVALCAYIVSQPGTPRTPTATAAMQEPAAVTRAPTEILLTATPAKFEPDPPNSIRTDDRSILDLTVQILAHLGLGLQQAQADQDNDVLSGVALTAIGVGSGKLTSAPQSRDEGLARLVAEALLDGRDDQTIHTLISAAVLDGAISVPSEMVGEDEVIATQLLLDTIIIQAALAAGN